MGAHTAPGHHPGRTATATAGVAAALVTTATGVLTGGTALASEGHGGSGHSGHSHDGGDSRSGHDRTDLSPTSSPHGFAEQTLCDVLGDVDLGGSSCSSDGSGRSSQQSDSSDATDDSSDDGSSGLLGSSFPGQSSEQTGSSQSHEAAPAPQPAPKPAPKPTSSVPDKPTVQPITAAPSTSKITG